jgi:hypothetical protein
MGAIMVDSASELLEVSKARNRSPKGWVLLDSCILDNSTRRHSSP